MARPLKAAASVAVIASAFGLAGCGTNPFTTASWSTRTSLDERECMARVMYFESNRSSPDGMTAVGTVVMNRLQSSRYPKTVCGVVGQENQFADGALSKPVSGRSWQLALAQADAVLGGERHPKVGAAMFFHTAGYTYPYRNMAYVVAAGGNVFYEKKTPGSFTPIHPNILVAQANGTARPRPTDTIVLARAEGASGPNPDRARGVEGRGVSPDPRQAQPRATASAPIRLAGREDRRLASAKTDRPTHRDLTKAASRKPETVRVAQRDEHPGRKPAAVTPLRSDLASRKPAGDAGPREMAMRPTRSPGVRVAAAEPALVRGAPRPPAASGRDRAGAPSITTRPVAAAGRPKGLVVASLPGRRGAADDDDDPPRKRR